MDNSAPHNVPDDLKQIVENVEKDLLDAIVKSLQANKIKVEEAQKLARDFIAQLPPSDQQDLLEKLQKISQMHPEARDVYFKYMHQNYEDDRTQKLHLMSQHIQNGDVESALKVAKGDTVNG